MSRCFHQALVSRHWSALIAQREDCSRRFRMSRRSALRSTTTVWRLTLIIRPTFEGARKRPSMSLGGGMFVFENFEKDGFVQGNSAESDQNPRGGSGLSRQPHSTALAPRLWLKYAVLRRISRRSGGRMRMSERAAHTVLIRSRAGTGLAMRFRHRSSLRARQL